MAFDPTANCSADVIARAAKVKLACFDVDGTLTDGRLWLDTDGRESKAFHVRDGLGLTLLRRTGVEIAFVTGRPGASTTRRALELGAELHAEISDKLACVRALAQAHGLGLDAIAFMGDDLVDVAVMRAVGFAAAPVDAHPWALQHAHWHSQSRGGEGAARELCDLLLATQGQLAALLP